MQVCPSNLFHHHGWSYHLGQMIIFQQLKQADVRLAKPQKCDVHLADQLQCYS